MPELTPQSTPPPDLPIPAHDEPPEDDPPASIPPIIVPKNFEEYPTFRETFLLYFTDVRANAATRAFGRLLHELTLEFWGYWPDHPEGIFRASLRAAVADLRHVQGALLEWTGESFTPDTPHEEFLASVGTDVAHALGELVDRLEKELGSWRGGA
jgi:hypothetical protein